MIKRVSGTEGINLVECINRAKRKYRIRYDVKPSDDGLVTFRELEYRHKPSLAEVKRDIIAGLNEEVTDAIVSGFSWRDIPVWLSMENQVNYAAAYDLAVKTAGKTLPVTFKIGSPEEPVYVTFADIDTLEEFYIAAMQHVSSMLAQGWQRKDTYDFTPYEQML